MDPEDPLGLVGTTIGEKYDVTALVGEGGFSLVYRAKHHILHHDVALKVFTGVAQIQERARNGLIEAFIREGELLASLSRRAPQIVQATDVGSFTSAQGIELPYLVLEWLEGCALDVPLLAARNRGQPGWSLEEVLDLLDGPFRALGRIHRDGIAHRDLKPANLFVVGGRLAPGAMIKLLDFGVAKIMDVSTVELAQTGPAITSFTPAYGAPEQFDRGHGATGPWTDVFAAALIMVEMLCGGRSALEGKTFGELGFSSANPQRRPTPRTLGAQISDAVEQVFSRALSVSPAERQPDLCTLMRELAAAASQSRAATALFDGAPPAIRPATDRQVRAAAPTVDAVQPPPSSSPATEEPPRRRRWLALSGALAAIAVAGAAVSFDTSSGTRDEDRGHAPAPHDMSSEPTAAAALPPSVSTCPNGMLAITGGKFFMGTDEHHPALEMARPAHQVEVGTFCIDRDEVTLAQYRRCSDIGECKRAYSDGWWPQGSQSEKEWERERGAYDELCNEAQGDGRAQHPVNCVTWGQAVAYCEWQDKRLPTEAEWEFAARGSDGRIYPWGDEPPDARHANACGSECRAWRAERRLHPAIAMHDSDDGFVGTSPVGSFAEGTTQWGLRDMVGNVFEWVSDPLTSYVGDDDASGVEEKRVIRGGAFNSYLAEFADPAMRYGAVPQMRSAAIGFRCAADPRLSAPL